MWALHRRSRRQYFPFGIWSACVQPFRSPRKKSRVRGGVVCGNSNMQLAGGLAHAKCCNSQKCCNFRKSASKRGPLCPPCLSRVRLMRTSTQPPARRQSESTPKSCGWRSLNSRKLANTPGTIMAVTFASTFINLIWFLGETHGGDVWRGQSGSRVYGGT
jgi:hypothetical protein